jgi:membrane-anchored protein YejM (alkaline phosphatase superfamily)
MSPSLSISHQKRLLAHYFLLTYVLVLFLSRGAIAFSEAWANGSASFLFMVAAFLCYGAIYLLPAIVVTWLVQRLSHWRQKHESTARNIPVYITAVLSTGLTTLFFYANAKIYALYGMFFNGFIINLLVTPGGIESLGGSGASDIGFALIATGFIVAQALLLWLVYTAYKKFIARQVLPQRFYRFLAIALALTAVGVHADYAIDNFSSNKLGTLAETVPFFQPVSSQHLFKSLGFKANSEKNLSVKGKLNYPIAPLSVTPPAKPYNIVWLASESWRADMLDPEIMPNTWKFAAGASRFTRNYSGGNGTRMGIFTMFMGIPGNYWFPFLREQRGAAIIDVLQQQNYQMSLYTSARFSYPEFDKTIFSKVPADQLHWIEAGQGWVKDKDNVTNLLNFIDKRDATKPFFTFMFFESPHARYYFPPESVIRRPYRDDINYASLSKDELSKDIVNIKNRYINSVHHLDSQFGRIFDYLAEHNLLDNTIVILLGDHGEEFMEHGFWGHNSTFVDEQIRTPLVIWAPGMKARVSDQMTSHMDVVPTLMPLLGVSNPASDYSTGYNLFSSEKRNHTYVSDWDRITFIDDEVKITQPVNIKSFGGTRATLGNDQPLPADQANQLLQKKQPVLRDVIYDLGKFFMKKNNSQSEQAKH